MDLAPARWIWLPSERTLANTFVLFRRTVRLDSVPAKVPGWILADSRYRLFVNGARVQWGPAPHDPRHAEVDPVELAPWLQVGENVIGVEVLFYGHGEGTWPFGKPGLLFSCPELGICSGPDWKCLVDRAHPPGAPKRWYLRALQETFDARLHPHGWSEPGFEDADWLDAAVVLDRADRPAFASGYPDYAYQAGLLDASGTYLRPRSIPLMEEVEVEAEPVQSGLVAWHRPPVDWFEFRVPDSFEIARVSPPERDLRWEQGEGAFLTLALPEGIVGFPILEIEASEGTVVEVMVQEHHDPEAHPWLDSHFFAWSRWICREGLNRFEAFDYEGLRWIQVHVHGGRGQATIHRVAVRQRRLPRTLARFDLSCPEVSQVLLAGINTLSNSCQDQIVDGMARERQQYSGDCGHQLRALRLMQGDAATPRRFLRQYAYGQMLDGLFSDSWPAWDRLNRLWERQIGATPWGVILDHSIGFVFDHFHHWMEWGDLEPARENWPRLRRLLDLFRRSLGQGDGLLPTEDLGLHCVWIDHDAFRSDAERRCAYNLYFVAMLRAAYAPMAEEIDPEEADAARELAGQVLGHVLDRYWRPDLGVFVNNLPDGADTRLDDRSLATSLLYDLCPDDGAACLRELAASHAPGLRGKESATVGFAGTMGRSYPPNMPWNYEALARRGRMDVVVEDLRARWATMPSVRFNRTLGEWWTAEPDTTMLMCHCPLAPNLAFVVGTLGVQVLEPGFAAVAIQPQLGGLEHASGTVWTPRGPIEVDARPERVEIVLPEGVELREAPSGARVTCR